MGAAVLAKVEEPAQVVGLAEVEVEERALAKEMAGCMKLGMMVYMEVVVVPEVKNKLLLVLEPAVLVLELAEVVLEPVDLNR
jgi:hypothetical protein